MAEYHLEIGRSAERELENLEPRLGRRILASIETLASVPRPRQARKLVGSANSFRLRIGQYRVLYQVDDNTRIVTVVAIGHGRDIYR
ncbi:MAG TPA: type II toxin-antitoxin system RelE/ParE family toxin [Dehalococcoidia bacterium]|nr:type II toxin-antitoxin system RelE/ParE family toxin [Dehalococcoidia bacterium]